MKHRYLVITELFLPTKGGTAVWFDEVYGRIGGKEIHIVTSDVPGGTEYDATHANTIHRVSMKRYWWLRPESLGMYIKLFYCCFRLIFKNKFDAVHAGRVLPEGLIALLIAKVIRKPVVIYAHGEEITTWRQPGKFKVMSFVYKSVDTVIANSEFTKNELLKLGVSNERIILISPGVDVERFKPNLEIGDLKGQLNISGQYELILSVGRLSRRKGFDNVIRSLPTLLEKGVDVHYAIIGIGEDKAYLEDIAAKLKMTKRVHFLGHVSSDDLPRWYNACSVFAMPNREINGDTEGFGMVFLEAGACGKPVIAGEVGGTGSAVIENETGFRINGEDPSEVYQALYQILSSGELNTKLGENAHLRVLDMFSWEKVAKKTRALL